jgi:hypothetical protein
VRHYLYVFTPENRNMAELTSRQFSRSFPRSCSDCAERGRTAATGQIVQRACKLDDHSWGDQAVRTEGWQYPYPGARIR